MEGEAPLQQILDSKKHFVAPFIQSAHTTHFVYTGKIPHGYCSDFNGVIIVINNSNSIPIYKKYFDS